MGIVFAQVVAVVGGHQRKSEIFFQTEKMGMYPVFHLQALVLYLKEEILFAEYVCVGGGSLARSVVLVLHQPFRHLAFQAS